MFIPQPKHLSIVLTATILAFFLSTQPAIAAQPPPGFFALPPYKQTTPPTTIDKKLLAAMEEYKVVGLSATVFRDNKIIWSSGYGWANLESARPVTPTTLFRVASLSKMVTATALMQLYDQGKFALDDDISNYLGYQVRNPSYPAIKITFRQLLTHTSSILDCGAYDSMIAETPALLRTIDIKDILLPGRQYYQQANFADYAPGSQFSYSNLGTGIIGSLVEKISGMSFDDYCTKYIFKPLNMDASFEPANIKNWKDIAVLYRPDQQLVNFRPTKEDYGGAKPQPEAITAPLGNALGRSPAGGLRASTADFSRFMQAHMNGGSYNHTRILKADTTELMHNMHWFGDGLNGFYKQKGLNFHITDDLISGRRLIGHSGEAYGLSSDAYYDPDSKFGVVFIMNGAHLADANPYYSVESTIAKTLFDSFAPRNTNKAKQLTTKTNSRLITVNDRKIFLPVPAVIAKSGKSQILFLPAISTADALSAGISQQGNQLTFTYGVTKAILTVDQTAMFVNGAARPLPQAPYKQNDHIMVPVRELADALKINYKLRL